VLGGEPIAMMFAIVSGAKAFLGKIAYDESFAKYSPGVLLTLDATEGFFAEGAINLVDSCAAPDDPMIGHLWRDRIEMCDLLLGPPGVSRLGFAQMVAAEEMRGRVRGMMKAMYRRLVE